MGYINNQRIKIIAMILMTIDHTGYIFELDLIFRIIGRLSFPIYAFLIYQGFLFSSNIVKYFKRLFLFGLIMEVLVGTANIFIPLSNLPLNIFLTLSFGLLSLVTLGSNLNIVVKLLGVIILAQLAEYMKFDYGWYGVILIASYYLLKYNIFLAIIVQIILNYVFYIFFNLDIQYYSLLSWVFILLYNGQIGKRFIHKYLMYFYYPLHLALLFLIKNLLF